MSDGIPRWPLPLAHPPRVMQLACVRQTTAASRRFRWRQPETWGLALTSARGSMADVAERWRVELAPGRLCALPPGAEVDLEFQPDFLQWEVRFSPVGDGGVVGLPALVDLGPDLPATERVLRQAIAVHGSDPARAAAAVWHLLHEIAARGRIPAEGPDAPPLLAAALAAIASHPTGNPGVAWLAHRLGCSTATLGRLFREHLGMPPARYLTMQRAERARDLLRSTALPIAQVARMCGMPDVQHFNKFVRRTLGAAPRGIRLGAAPRGG